MRHRVAHRKLGRVTEHRISMLRNLSTALFEHERIQTTVARAKELRPYAEHLISVAKRSLDAPDGSSRNVTARRMVAKDIADREILQKLFATIAPRYVDRAGGYTRMFRLGHRRGDAAELAEVELLGSEYNPDAASEKAGAESADQPKKKTVAGRIRDVFSGRKSESGQQTPAKPSRTSRGAGKKVTTPRKAGGS